jgi:hypothetical protein
MHGASNITFLVCPLLGDESSTAGCSGCRMDISFVYDCPLEVAVRTILYVFE